MDAFRSKHQLVLEVYRSKAEPDEESQFVLGTSLTDEVLEEYAGDSSSTNLGQFLTDGWRVASLAATPHGTIDGTPAIVFVLERPADLPLPDHGTEPTEAMKREQQEHDDARSAADLAARPAPVPRDGECDNCGRKGQVVGVTAHSGSGPAEDPDGPEVMELCAGGCSARAPL